MAYEILVGLQVTDQKSYQKYREAMTPMLHEHGGDFGYDFHIAEVVKPEAEKHINRVFTIHFPNQEEHDAFFDNPHYKVARAEFFEPAVAHVNIMASYHRE